MGNRRAAREAQVVAISDGDGDAPSNERSCYDCGRLGFM